MPLLDERGRLFGKVNIVDAAAVLTVVLLIPLAYATYLLFREAPPQLLAVEPAQVPLGTPEVTVRGENLRPDLRLSIGPLVGATFLFEHTGSGVLRLPPTLGPGTYDVVLFNEDLEVGRLRDALTIRPLAAGETQADVAVLGSFAGLTMEQAQEVASSLGPPPKPQPAWGSVLASRGPERNIRRVAFSENVVSVPDDHFRVPAILRLQCTMAGTECRVGTNVITARATLPLSVGDEQLPFVVDEAYPMPDRMLDVVVVKRLPPALADAASAALRRDAAQRSPFDLLVPQLVDVTTTGTGDWRTVTARLRVPATQANGRWLYRGQPLQVNDAFGLQRDAFSFGSLVVSITPDGAFTGGR